MKNESRPDGVEYADAEVVTMMQAIADVYYRSACGLQHHRFIELAGLMNEVIRSVDRLAQTGRCIWTSELELQWPQLVYIAEKLTCILGERGAKELADELAIR